MCQAGDFTRLNGTGGKSIYGEKISRQKHQTQAFRSWNLEHGKFWSQYKMVLSSSLVLLQCLGWMENMLSYQVWMLFLPLNKLEVTRARPKWQSWFLIVDNYNKYVDMQICCFILWSKKYVPGLSLCVSVATALYAYLILWWVCPTRNNPKWPKQVVLLILSLGFHSSRPISSVKTECNKRYFVNTLSGELQHTLHFFNPKD